MNFYDIGFGEDIVGVLLQKKKGEPIYKDGFHIVYPDVVMGEGARRNILCDLDKVVTDSILYKDLFDGLKIVKSKLTVVDEGVVKSFWAAPGSCKNGMLTYVVTAVFKGKFEIFERDHMDHVWVNPEFCGIEPDEEYNEGL